MKIFASISIIPFLLTCILFGHTAFAAETESGCDPIQHLSRADAAYVTPDILQSSYAEVREYMGVSEAGERIMLRYPFNADQSETITEALRARWGLQLDATNIMFIIYLEPQRTQLVLASDTKELARLDFILRDGLNAALAFASVSTPDGRSSCIKYTEMYQFLWEEIVNKILVETYPEGLPVAME